MSFWEGFEKRAKAKAPGNSKAKLALLLAGASAGGLALGRHAGASAHKNKKDKKAGATRGGIAGTVGATSAAVGGLAGRALGREIGREWYFDHTAKQRKNKAFRMKANKAINRLKLKGALIGAGATGLSSGILAYSLASDLGPQTKS